jgi:hypothetical protein
MLVTQSEKPVSTELLDLLNKEILHYEGCLEWSPKVIKKNYKQVFDLCKSIAGFVSYEAGLLLLAHFRERVGDKEEAAKLRGVAAAFGGDWKGE